MTQLDRDCIKILCGAGDEVIARRTRELNQFENEHRKCLNPYRKELLYAEIERLRLEHERLRQLKA